jgi:uncharacterized protein (DUF2267 family)
LAPTYRKDTTPHHFQFTSEDILDELIKQITQRTGISEEQAKQAVAQVLEFLNQRLPAPIASQVEGLLKGGMPDLGGLGGLFGRK